MFKRVISRRNVGRFHIYFLNKKHKTYASIVIFCHLLILYDEYYIMFTVEKNDKTHTIVKRGQCLKKNHSKDIL